MIIIFGHAAVEDRTRLVTNARAEERCAAVQATSSFRLRISTGKGGSLTSLYVVPKTVAES